MLKTTVSLLKCPVLRRDARACGGALELNGAGPAESAEVPAGTLRCEKCGSGFPILAGVAVVVEDPGAYLAAHVKGVSQIVPDTAIPGEYRADYLRAKREIAVEHIEEDLEAERVVALYLMNHYLRADERSLNDDPWWKPRGVAGSPAIESLIKEHWDRGPFAHIREWVREIAKKKGPLDVIELGCGVGGLYRALGSHIGRYLGVDSSFASVALARHMVLGAPYSKPLRVPADLLHGPVSREVRFPVPKRFAAECLGDFVVGDIDHPPLEKGRWDVAIALNAIDMLEDPSTLPRLQYDLVGNGGVAIQSGPYVWHEWVARQLRSKLPKGIQQSSRAVEWLYEQAGFRIRRRIEHAPWLFFKHVRQLEIYSVHLLQAEKSPAK